jgi:hypothetical protein
MRVEELVTDGFIAAPGSVSADECRLYFYSNKDSAETGGYDLMWSSASRGDALSVPHAVVGHWKQS